MSKRQVTAVVFDLDGTLVDSLPGIEASLRVAAATCDPPRELPPIRSVIGPPIVQMIERLWPDINESERQRAVTAFREHYDREGCLLSPLFEGVAATLEALGARGIAMFVLTNKPRLPTRLILDRAGIRPHFRDVISPDTNTPPFPVKREGAAWLATQHQLRPETTLVVGDGIDDGEAAAHCGFSFAIAGYGYGSAVGRQDLEPIATLKTFSEITEIVL